MKYKLLKQIEDNWSIPVWSIFECWEILSVDNPQCEIPVSILIRCGYIEKIEDKIDPKFSVWEKVIYEWKDFTFFTEIKWIRILDWEVMYYLFEWFYKEEYIKRASEECQNKKSKFYWIFPF